MHDEGNKIKNIFSLKCSINEKKIFIYQTLKKIQKYVIYAKYISVLRIRCPDPGL